MLKEFKEFAMKGNVLDMAIGVIIGGAFGKIITSLVSDVLMPPLGLLLGKVDFSSLFLNLSGTPQPSLAAAKAAGDSHRQLRCVSADRVGFHHHRVRDLHAGEASEPAQDAGRPFCSDHQRLSLMPIHHSDQGDEVCALHVSSLKMTDRLQLYQHRKEKLCGSVSPESCLL